MLNLNSATWEFHDPLPPQATLWRYMDFTKFVSLLEGDALFFARADKFGDPFEGALPIDRTPQYADLADEEVSKYKYLRAELRRFTLISCWHESVHESDAMWKIYSSANSGIAIKTTCDAFVRSFRVEEQIHLGKVRYIDHENEDISAPRDNWLSPYFYKRNSFAHEQEVRAIIQHVPNEPHPDDLPDPLTREKLPIWQDICDHGMTYEVDLNELIQEIVVDPSAPDLLLHLVHLVAKRYGLQASIQASIRKSDLAVLPEQFSL